MKNPKKVWAEDYPDRRQELIQALRNVGVKDEAVLAVLAKVPREMFLTGPFVERAYDNVALPIGYQQTISQPWVVAIMTSALELNDRHKVLEVGTGCGYQSVILAHLCRRLYTIERHKGLLEGAEARFKKLRLTNITTHLGDGSLGWPQQAPFDRIIVTAAAEDLPPVLLDQLAPGGIMVCPVGSPEYGQRLLKVCKTDAGLKTEDLGGVAFVPLVEGEVNA